MRNQNRKDRPGSLCKRGGASGGGAGGGSTGRVNVKDAPDTLTAADIITLPPRMDVFDVFDDIATVAPNAKASDAQEVIRRVLNLGPKAKIPDEVSSAQAAQIMRLMAIQSRFNLRTSDLSHYLNY